MYIYRTELENVHSWAPNLERPVNKCELSTGENGEKLGKRRRGSRKGCRCRRRHSWDGDASETELLSNVWDRRGCSSAVMLSTRWTGEFRRERKWLPTNSVLQIILHSVNIFGGICNSLIANGCTPAQQQLHLDTLAHPARRIQPHPFRGQTSFAGVPREMLLASTL